MSEWADDDWADEHHLRWQDRRLVDPASRHRSVEVVYLPGTAPLEKHDLALHLRESGSVGTDVAGCPRCDQTRGMPRSIECPLCRRTSWRPDDIWQGYCGGCHAWTSPAFQPH